MVCVAPRVERPQGFFKATHALMLAPDLTATEKALVIAIGLYDWGNSGGCRVSNARLARYVSLDTEGTDGGSRCVRRLLAGLASKGYVRIETAPQTEANRTGRAIYLQPKATGGGTEPRTIPAEMDGRTPDTMVLPPRTTRPGDPGRSCPPNVDLVLDPEETPSEAGGGSRQASVKIEPAEVEPVQVVNPETIEATSLNTENSRVKAPDRFVDLNKPIEDEPVNPETIEATERLSDLARRTFDPSAAIRVIGQIQLWFAFVQGKVPNPERIIELAILKARNARPGCEPGYALAVIERAVEAIKASPPSPPVVKPDRPVVLQRIESEAASTEANQAVLRARWSALDPADREAIEAMVRAESPWASRAGRTVVFEGLCLAKLAPIEASQAAA